MRRPFRHGPLAAFAFALVLGACSAPPLGPLELDPPGPVALDVGGSVDFTASPIPNGVDWTVDGALGGTAATGTVSATGTYVAPDRVLDGPTLSVTVTATDPVVAGRAASADVAVTAHGTFYVVDDMIHVYGGVHEVDGDVAPDRSFTIQGVEPGDDFYDMRIAPALDLAFIVAATDAPRIFRVPSISTASGVVTDFATFDDGGFVDPSGVAYDPVRDILYVRLVGGLLVFDDASTAPDGATADRVLNGPNVGSYVDDDDVRISLDVQNDRIFLSNPFGSVAVYDDASTIDGNLAPDRVFSITVAGLNFLWGASYDASRDELYLGDQRFGAAVYVMAGASTATGLIAPDRVIGGPVHPLASPSMVSYDATNDRLVVVLSGSDGFAIFDDASTVNGDVPADRVVIGPSVPLNYAYGGYLDPTQ